VRLTFQLLIPERLLLALEIEPTDRSTIYWHMFYAGLQFYNKYLISKGHYRSDILISLLCCKALVVTVSTTAINVLG
jgi:hypothetical protein